MKRAGRILINILLGLVVSGMTAWTALAIFYSNLPGILFRTILAVLFVLFTTVSFLFLPHRRRTFTVFILIVGVIIAWWLVIPPSLDRNWQKDVAVTPYATIRNDTVTLHNIRNFNYRTETDFNADYYDKTYHLSDLDSVDLISVYWMGDAVAHIMVSFGFQQKDFVTFSIETRKEQGEDYSSIKGFFKQYELIYIVGDERDLIRVRTDYRNPREDVYLYRVRIPPDKARKLLINMMKDRPVWYNTLTTNCATNIIMHIQTFSDRIHYNWKIFLSGYTPLYAYELGILNTHMPFAELRKLSYINPKAHAIGNDPEFSRKIREGLPQPER